MKTRADKLLEQIQQAQKTGQKILAVSGLTTDGIIYAFATQKALVINCKNYAALWRFDDGQLKLREAIAQLKFSIDTILIEKNGKTLYEF